MRRAARRRPGLTLLEMVLTFAIAMLVLLALFMVMHSQYGHAQAGREAIAEATLARAILTRVGNDIVCSLGPVDPRFLPKSILPNNANQSGGNAGNSQAGSGMQGNTGASGNTGTTGNATSGATGNTGASATPNSSSSSSGSSSTAATTPVPYNLGVKGDSNWLILSCSRVPGALILSPKAAVTDNSIISSDLRSISYWLADGGLARREMTNVNADDAPTDQPDSSNASQYVIAPEVRDILFEYFDGVSWQPNWDGGALGGNDGNTPVGPPAAIAITITLKSTRPGSDTTDQQPTKYKHVVAIPASNAFTLANQSGSGQQLSGNALVPALQAGQQIPSLNQQNQQNQQGSSTTSGQ